jgi:hypothetical protein
VQNGGGQRLENRGEVARIWGWNALFKADVEGVERQGTPLTHQEAAGGSARGDGLGRPRQWWGRCSEGVRGAQKGRKMFLFSTSSLRLGVWWVIPGGLVREIGRPDL